MHAELLRMASELAERDEPFVLAVVVRRLPASSAQAGDMALITVAGDFHGWLGGSCTQPTVVREARRALADGRPRLVSLSPDPEAERRPGVAVFPMTCHSGGSVEIYLDPILPAPRLLVFGVSPIAQALARLGKAMGYSVFAGDAAAGGAARGACYAVVATMGEGDEEAIRAALALRPAYIGVVASAKRFAEVRESLLSQGVAAAALDSIRSPAGVAIGAQEPAEIAVSVLAEIVARRHAAAEGEEPAASGQAIDPVCGMTVETAGARHTAEAGGRTWYFCGGGCRERFLAAPERFAASREPAAPAAPAEPRRLRSRQRSPGAP
jgi:xanthine dehydrogenase accessory factor